MVEKLLMLLAERDRLVLLPDLLAAYRDRLLDHQHVVRAEVTTAAPLAPDRANAIERSLAQVTGRTVTVHPHRSRASSAASSRASAARCTTPASAGSCRR